MNVEKANPKDKAGTMPAPDAEPPTGLDLPSEAEMRRIIGSKPPPFDDALAHARYRREIERYTKELGLRNDKP